MEASEANLAVRRTELAVRSTLQRLRAQIRTAKRQRYPGDHPGPYQWLAVAAGVIDTAEEYLNRITIPPKEEDPRRAIRNAAELLAQAYRILTLMNGCGIDDLSYPTVPPLQRWFSSLGISDTILFRAETVANYEILAIPRELFADIRLPSESLLVAIDRINWPLLRVTVPSKAFSFLPHMAIVAHEIGHALYSNIKWDLSGIRSDNSGIQANIERRIKFFDDSVKSLFLNISGKWHEELAADAIAFFLAGPAAFFALSDFLTYMGNTLGFSDTHPPNGLRRDILFEALCDGAENSFSHILTKYAGVTLTRDFNSSLMDTPATSREIMQAERPAKGRAAVVQAICAELVPQIKQAVPQIYRDAHSYLKENCPSAIYNSRKFNRDLANHLSALILAIPPIEEYLDDQPSGDSLSMRLSSRVPVEFSTILNVGWVAMLTKSAELNVRTSGGPDDQRERLEKIHGLLLKAVELSEALRSWQSSRRKP